MSRKKKRQIRVETSAPETRTAQDANPFQFRSLREEFNPDYSYVIKDLRRIGALAGSFVLILVVLSFFLR
ncbi:MAG TPA: hypothetical protein VJ436_03065 [Anaerolineales bacterium]|nr:hypothetical protein [Anaerolineales bacterium]